MKIVHEFHGKQPQATCGGHPYGSPVDGPPKWNGMRVECLVVDSSQPEFDENGKETKPFYSGDALYIEGNYESVKMALEELLQMMKYQEEWHKEQFEKNAAEYRQCPKCKTWAHPKHDWHGDGKGNECRFPQ